MLIDHPETPLDRPTGTAAHNALVAQGRLHQWRPARWRAPELAFATREAIAELGAEEKWRARQNLSCKICWLASPCCSCRLMRQNRIAFDQRGESSRGVARSAYACTEHVTAMQDTHVHLQLYSSFTLHYVYSLRRACVLCCS